MSGKAAPIRDEVVVDPTQVQPINTDKTFKVPSWLLTGGAVLLIAGVASVIAAYFINPQLHSFFDHIFAEIQSGAVSIGHAMQQSVLTGQQALLYVTLPVLGVGGIIGAIVLVVRVHKRNQKNADHGASTLLDIEPQVKRTLIEMEPKTHLRNIGIAAGVIAALALTTFLLYQFLPQAHDFIQHYAVDGVLQHSFKLWEVIAYFGGSAALVSVITGLGVALAQYRIDAQRKLRLDLTLGWLAEQDPISKGATGKTDADDDDIVHESVNL